MTKLKFLDIVRTKFEQKIVDEQNVAKRGIDLRLNFYQFVQLGQLRPQN